MKIIAIANHKGGVGKTTTTASIGAALAKRQRKVLLIDLDAQANLSTLFFKESELDEMESVYDTLTTNKKLPQYQVREDLLGGLYLTPASLSLAKAEMEMSYKMEREKILSKAISKYAHDYDYILLDCPPGLGVLVTNALFAADEVYIPVTAEAMPLKGLTTLEDVISTINESYGRPIISGVIITRFDSRKNICKTVENGVRDRYGSAVFSTVVRDNVALVEAPLHSQDIFSYDSRSKGAADYDSIVDEILKREKKDK